MASLLLAAPGMVLAHAGHSHDPLAASAGFMHPFTGIDHLLMMLCVGIWAGRSGGALRWQLPATFLAGMAAGWALGFAGLIVPGLESGIAATLIALGVVLALQLDLPRAAQFAGVAVGAVLHGLAHGGELGGAGWPGGLGMLAATALLHGAGFAATRLAPSRDGLLYRLAGALLALAGGALLAAG